MALIRCSFYSEALELGTSMTVLLPQSTSTQIGVADSGENAPPPVLYLLHGLTDDDTAWTRYTSIERYAAAKGLAVVMPQVHRSFYADERHGGKFWTFLSEELPRVVASFFRVSTRREDTFVAGLSMGGYGALKLALRQPERFAAAASLSGALDLAHIYRHDDRPHIVELMARVFGDRDPAGTPDDLLHLVREADPDDLPRLLVRCGAQDVLLPQNERFVAAARDAAAKAKAAKGHPAPYAAAEPGAAPTAAVERGAAAPEAPKSAASIIDAEFGPGEHEWGYWDSQIQHVLNWLPIK